MRRFSPLLRLLALAVSVHVGALCLPTTAYAQRSSDSVAPSPAATVHKKYPALAATLAIVPGAGHLYAGEVRRGLTVVGAIAVVSFGSALAAVGDCTVGVSSNSNDESCENDAILTAGGIVILGIWGWSIVDAGMAANRTNRRHAQAPKIAQLARMPVRVGVSHRPTPSGGETRTLTLGLRFAVR